MDSPGSELQIFVSHLTDNCEPPDQEPNLGPPGEHYMCLTTEPSLLPLENTFDLVSTTVTWYGLLLILLMLEKAYRKLDIAAHICTQSTPEANAEFPDSLGSERCPPSETKQHNNKPSEDTNVFDQSTL